ncbi:hypothetical protein NHU_04165 [Rhodovulum sulfidophilum]|uniref:Ribbon-helix-helix protein CopG domain-containing protein n=1 Tax=Rhodovulum sulfidophilum TaxID=35806 RepID=A0A0D6B923_RHOSU|nr:hypothetical protein NHU_04165 [Rhodovulum sulfidophilum]
MPALYGTVKPKINKRFGIMEKKRGRPSVDTEAINLRLPRQLIEAIDDARRNQPDLPTRPEMIRRILNEWQCEVSAKKAD